MISSFTRKVKTLIFNEEPVENNVINSRKRKREDECGVDWSDGDGDVIITAVKRPKTNHISAPFNFFANVIGNPYQKMSDWFKSKKWENSYFFKRPNDRRAKQNNGGMVFQQQEESGTNGHVTDGREYPRYERSDRSRQSAVSTVPSVSTQIPHHTERVISATDKQVDNVEVSHARQVPKAVQSAQDSEKKSLFATRPYRNFTATQCVRLDEREKYKMLLQRFTSVPISTSPSSLHDLDRLSIDSRGSSRYQESILGDSYSSDLFKRNEKVSYRDALIRKRVSPTCVQKESFSVVNHQRKETNNLNSTRVDPPHHKSSDISSTSPLHSSATVSVVVPTNQRQSKSQGDDRRVMSPQVKNEAEVSAIPSVNGPDVSVIGSDNNYRSDKMLDFKKSQYIEDDWMASFTVRFSTDSRERHRKIAEEEIRAKVFDERRKANEEYLEKQVRERLKIFEKEPAIPPEIPIDEVEEEEEFPALTEDMDNVVKDALRPNPPDEVLVDGFKLQITRNDVATLAGLNWLNDEIINFYMNLLVERGEKQGAPKVYAFNTFFYPKIIQGGHSAVRRWTRRVDIFAVDYIIIPVHLGMHWCLAVVDFKKKLIQYLDSMGGNNKPCLNAIKKYLCDESMDKKKKDLDLTGWTTETAKDIPQQMNGSDCGMFACKYAEYITREAQITFTQQHMPYFRRRMVYEIVKKKLLQ